MPRRYRPKPIEQRSFRIWVNEQNIVEVAFFGAQTLDSVSASIEAMIRYARWARENRLPALILIDNAGITKTSIAANQRALRGLREIPYTKLAGINANPVLRIITNAITAASGRGDRIRQFPNRRTAVHWLLHSSKPASRTTTDRST